jgi:hypothetical protein
MLRSEDFSKQGGRETRERGHLIRRPQVRVVMSSEDDRLLGLTHVDALKLRREPPEHPPLERTPALRWWHHLGKESDASPSSA